MLRWNEVCIGSIFTIVDCNRIKRVQFFEVRLDYSLLKFFSKEKSNFNDNKIEITKNCLYIHVHLLYREHHFLNEYIHFRMLR